MSFHRRQLLAAAGVVVFAKSASLRAETATPDTAAPDKGAQLLNEMTDLLRPRPEDTVLGSDKAPVTIVEYASMSCPHCAHFDASTFRELKQHYIDTGKVLYIFREFPLDPPGAAAFMLARCTGKEKYMAIVEALFARQNEWLVQEPLAPLKRIAGEFGLTDESIKQCLTNQSALDRMESDRNIAAEKLGVDSTPTFFINGKKLVGDQPIEAFAKEIDPYLKAE